MIKKVFTPLSCALALTASIAHAAPVSFTDPTGDDFGPGSYTYPTNTVYADGAFDMTGFRISEDGSNYIFEVDVNADLKDAWNTGSGFDIQMFFVFIDQGNGKNTKGLPGLNIQFAEDSAWENVVVISPQSPRRVKAETRKAKQLKSSIVVPESTQGSGRTITAIVPKGQLNGDPSSWRLQVVGQSNEGFPEGSDLLTRRINSKASDHRFGGGDDGQCDPHVIDILGDHSQLNYECGSKLATIDLLKP